MTAERRPRAPGWYVVVVRLADNFEARVIGPYASERIADRAEAGVMRNMNHADYGTFVREEKP